MTISFHSEDNQIVPTANALESRLRIFQATQRPKFIRNQKIETPWGEVTITGRIGQRHCDLSEFIRVCAERKREWGGKLWLLVDPYKLRQKMGKYYSHEQIKILIKDLTEASVQIETENEHWTFGHLIDYVIESTVERANPLAFPGGKRKLWAVEVGIPGRKLLFEGIKLFYDPVPIARLKSGMSQAIARHVLGHTTKPNGGWKLDSLLEAVAGKMTGKRLSDARCAVREDSEGLLEIGIEVKEGRINLLNENGFIGQGPVSDIFGAGLVLVAVGFVLRVFSS
jgi:hypothetical protein